MNPESLLDVVCRVTPGILSSIKTVDSVALLGAVAPLELSLSLFQVLMAFAEKTTARQVFHTLDTDVGIDEFGRIIKEFFDHGLLQPDFPSEDGPSLQQFLGDRVFASPTLTDKVRHAMRQGRAIVVPDALPAELAERVHHELDRSNRWTVAEDGHDFYHYRTSGIEQFAAHGGALAECGKLFCSSATRRFIGELSGQDCTGTAYAAAAWYRPGEYALPHDDLRFDTSRSVSYIWYLTKDWRPEWGGALFWCPTGQYVSPKFNTLVMFNVTPSNMHFVCPVAPTATGKRLTINGFWHHAKQWSPPVSVPPDTWISPQACGEPRAENPDLLPIVVL
jgi:Rps23 Pro-64 3,4-dihydroxylase Tpa1-like proline 4-hydroxylase